MKYINRSLVEEPEILRGQAAPAMDDKIDSKIYGHEDVKTALKELQHGICCYCESCYKSTTFGDVEHYRPKGFYQQHKDDKQHRPGYYWLAYKWENLMYACEVCNRIYKKNYFPLKDPTKRFDKDLRNISQEEPLLINPYEEKNPGKHLTFDENRIIPLTDEGKASIEYYGLDRVELDESRLQIYNPIMTLAKLLQIAKGSKLEQPTMDELKKTINDNLSTGRYTLMIKCNFGQYL